MNKKDELIKSVKSQAWNAFGETNPVLAQKVANALEGVINNVLQGDCDSERMLPKTLRRKSWKRSAFDRAIKERYITWENGRMVSHFETTVELSYFCARCFCDDYPERSGRRRYRWKKGKSRFPARELERFFGVRNLREARQNHLEKEISEALQMIDRLFV